MRFTEITPLTEATGISHRKPGDEFVNTTDPTDKIYIKSVEFYPKEAKQYDSVEQIVSAIDSIKSKYIDVPIKFTNTLTSTARSFGVAMFNRAGSPDTTMIFIKPFKELSGSKIPWDNQTGIPGYRYNSKAANKESSGLSPADILTKFKDLSANDIVDQIGKKLGVDHSFTRLAERIANGQQFPIEVEIPPNGEFVAFRDYFCELLHPIALQSGSYTGNAGDAAMRFLSDNSFEDTSISFSQAKNEGLYDSILTSKDGKEIKVSSKGGQGAAASVKNLLDVIGILEKSGSKLLNDTRVKDVVQIIKTAVQAGQYNSPLKLAIKYDIISNADAEQIVKWKSMVPINMKDIDSIEMSDVLRSLVKTRVTKFPERVNLYLHSISAVAHTVSQYINANTDFSTVASTILNNAALIQVYSRIRQKENKWIIDEFFTKWPQDDVAGVEFSASKNYSSTNINGNFTFKILTNKDSSTAYSNTKTPVPSRQAASSTQQAAEPSATYNATSPEIERQIFASLKHWANMFGAKYGVTNAATIDKIAQEAKQMIARGVASSDITAHFVNLYGPESQAAVVNTRTVAPRSTAPKSPAVFAPFDASSNVKVKNKQAGSATYRFKR